MKRVVFLAVTSALALAAWCLADSPPPPALAWDYSPDAGNPASNIVFLVYQTTNLAQPVAQWPVVAIVPTNRFPIIANLPACFYRVRSSNTVTHLASD